jgi:hypothetical protein
VILLLIIKKREHNRKADCKPNQQLKCLYMKLSKSLAIIAKWSNHQPILQFAVLSNDPLFAWNIKLEFYMNI